MAIGANWAEIWNAAIWGPVWSQVPPEPPDPEPEQLTQTPAGSSRSKHKAKKRYFVEIDGQQFAVSDASQAVELLQRARAIAESQAEQKAAVAEKRLKAKPRIPVVRLGTPVISVSPELRKDAAPLIADIERLYAKAAEIAELRLLMAKQLADEQDEEDALLLLI